MSWRCRLGFHDWSTFGDCTRCGEVHVTFADYVEGFGHLMSGTDWRGPWTRVAERKGEAKRQAGRELQAKLADLGADVSLEMCVFYAGRPEEADCLIRYVTDTQTVRAGVRVSLP